MLGWGRLYSRRAQMSASAGVVGVGLRICGIRRFDIELVHLQFQYPPRKPQGVGGLGLIPVVTFEGLPEDIGLEASDGLLEASLPLAPLLAECFRLSGGETLPSREELERLRGRQWLAHQMGGGRGVGVDPRWDMGPSNRMISGVLPLGGQWSQRVFNDRPCLRLTATGGDARVSVRAGISQGGGETTRAFVLGGGFTATFNLAGFESAHVQIFLQEPAATTQFMWCTEAMSAGDQTLYNPVRIVAGAAAQAVPQGAYAIILRTTDAAWQWTNTVIASVPPTQSVPVALTTNTTNTVMGTRFIANIDNEAVWLVRPI